MLGTQRSAQCYLTRETKGPKFNGPAVIGVVIIHCFRCQIPDKEDKMEKISRCVLWNFPGPMRQRRANIDIDEVAGLLSFQMITIKDARNFCVANEEGI